MNKNWMLFLLALTLGLATPGAAHGREPNKTSAKASNESAATAASQDKDDEIRDVLMGLEGALASKKSEAAAALFAEHAVFIDQAGDETRGRQLLQDRFAALFKQGGAPSLGLHPESINFPASNVALVVGEVSRKQGSADLPATRFSMVLSKESAAWKISEVTETVIQAAQTEYRLQELDWMIGEWKVNKANASAQLSVEWAPGKKFILSKLIVNKSGQSPQIDTQVIGWDPHSNGIISWHFDSNGGFGSGVWSKRSDKDEWSVVVHGTGADGSTTDATNVFSLNKPGQFTWQSVHRSLDETPVADSEALTVERVKR